jgi:DNA polymerase V
MVATFPLFPDETLDLCELSFGVAPAPALTTIGLADCNNFYAACERVFRPALAERAVIVLSNNDGCVIARSAEAKQLGITMGAPVHEVMSLIKQHEVVVCSANFALYGDLSRRVMSILSQRVPSLEVYSIDEAFLDFAAVPVHVQASFAQNMRAQIKRWTGIPLSIGIAQTKTLAKLANDWAKKRPSGVLALSEETINGWLLGTNIEDVWNIGPRRARFLKQHGVVTAYDLKYANSRWIRQHLYLPGARTQLELRGVPCFPLTNTRTAKQEITSSRSFGSPVHELADLKEALAFYATRACEKLRAQHSLARTITVFLSTNIFRETEPQYQQSVTIKLPHATAYTPEIVNTAHRAVEHIYQPGYAYHKAGITLSKLVSDEWVQGELFAEPPDLRQEAAMTVVDSINKHFGRDTIHVAATGQHKRPADQPPPSWQMKQEHVSPCYTTRWNELAQAQ